MMLNNHIQGVNRACKFPFLKLS